MWGIRNSITIHYEIIFFPLELDGYFNLEIRSFLFGGERVLLSSQPPLFPIYIFTRNFRHAILETATLSTVEFYHARTTEQTNEESKSGNSAKSIHQRYRIHRHTHQSLPRLKPPTVLPVSSQALRFKLGKRASNRTLTVYCYNFDTRLRWFTGEKSITERKLSLRNLDFSII